MKTSTIKASAPTWFIVDATDQTIGDLSSKVAHVLRGKHKPTFSPHQLCGDVIVVVNASKLAVSPTKMRRKDYHRHSGWLGHIKKTSLKEMMEMKPEQVIEKAVYGMLPRNRLREDILHRLHVFADDKHPYAPQKPQSLDLSTLL